MPSVKERIDVVSADYLEKIVPPIRIWQIAICLDAEKGPFAASESAAYKGCRETAAGQSCPRITFAIIILHV